ncbi:MAG TPA: hypothetical protein VGJ86_03795 [Acidimicrobiales bacterium]|jgi:hypothetical protein
MAGLIFVIGFVIATADTASAQPTADQPASTCDTLDTSGLSSSIVPDDCWGRFPSSHYDIGCDEGAWNNISRKVYCTFTDLAFGTARSLVAFALWVIEWAYGFSVYDRLGQPMVALADRYQTGIVGPLGLQHAAWTYAIAWTAIMSLRGRLTMAAGEITTSIVLAGLAGFLLANPAGYLEGTFTTMGTVSGALLSAGSGQPPPHNGADAQTVLAPLQAQIHKAFVEDPYDVLNWGGPLTGDCADTRDQILATGPHGTSDDPRNAMHDAGCDDQADFNHEPTGTRLNGAILTLLASLLMVALVVLISLTVVIAQIVAVVLFAVAPFAALAAILPGGGRELAWRWLAALVRAGLVVIGMSFVLSLLLLAVQALLVADMNASLSERFVLVNIVVIAMFIARKRIVGAGAQFAAHLGGRLSAYRPGGERSQTWLSAAAAGGVSGYAVGSTFGVDPRSRTGRLTSFLIRDAAAEFRLRRHYNRSERRARLRTAEPVLRERTELTLNGQGEIVPRRSLNIDGPAPTTRRARKARNDIEAAATRRTKHPEYRESSGARWSSWPATDLSHDDFPPPGGPEPPPDPEQT